MSRLRPLRAMATAGALALGLSCGAADAWAQRAVVAGAADAMSGVEGGGSGYAAGVQQARTTLRLGAEGYVDEFPNDVFGAAAIIEIEPSASIGADVRYLRQLGESFALHIGAIGIIAPKHMIGATFGAAFRIALGDSFKLQVGPTANVYFLGADLPDDRVLWQGMIQGGVRVEF